MERLSLRSAVSSRGLHRMNGLDLESLRHRAWDLIAPSADLVRRCKRVPLVVYLVFACLVRIAS